jgi:hypothetical protein
VIGLLCHGLVLQNGLRNPGVASPWFGRGQHEGSTPATVVQSLFLPDWNDSRTVAKACASIQGDTHPLTRLTWVRIRPVDSSGPALFSRWLRRARTSAFTTQE